MKPLSSARIGYGGYSRDFSRPGDRRRFSAYAAQRGIAYEYPSLDRDYDVVLLSQNADLTGWTERKRREGDRFALIIDLVDPYFEQKRLDERILKGIGRFIEGRDSRLSPDFRRTLEQACRAADGVFCSTPEQRETILRYCPDVEISFDWFDGELGLPKQDFRREGRLKLVWEGQAGTLRSIRTLRAPLNAVKDRVELHVVTDPSVPRWYGRIGTKSATELLAGIECPIRFHPWSKEDFSAHITAADLAIVPMDLSHSMFRAKPENKLVLLWKLGMPVLAGPTPAYRRAMRAAGLDMVCATPEEWGRQLAALASAPGEELEALARQGREHALAAYDLEAFQRPFDRLFARSGFGV
ncbi:MAG: hypothetical protein ACK4K7_00935 [Allosphingosinicella sp.]|uniref:hypothetical protein n=1 Tax=Allosphingosinicella sp. TaxID=2823234 RepID=UPI0039502D2B